MPKAFSRQELYDLVWSQPMRTVAASVGVSDVALAKACRKANIPVPARGYWAKKANGKASHAASLPMRFPGASDKIEIGGNPHRYWNPSWKQELAEAEIPPIPFFEEEMDALSDRVRRLVGKASAERDFSRAFGDVAKLLAHDEERRNSRWSIDKPKYDGGIERRRLLILLSLSHKLHALGCKLSMHTSKYGVDLFENRGVAVSVGSQLVRFTLEPPSGRVAKRNGTVTREGTCLRLEFESSHSSALETRYWDDAEGKLEGRLCEIIAAILIRSETQYRHAMHRHREWVIEQKEQLRIEEEKRIAEAEQKARERRLRQERERVARLMSQAAALRKAETIRSYVEAVRLRALEMPTESATRNSWAVWALAEADRIDPVTSGAIFQSLSDSIQAESDGVETDDRD